MKFTNDYLKQKDGHFSSSTNDVASKNDKPAKTALMFSLAHSIGSLANALKPFEVSRLERRAENSKRKRDVGVAGACLQELKINMEHIESRPSKTSSDCYDFFVECIDCDSAKLSRLVECLEEHATNVRVCTENPDDSPADSGCEDATAFLKLSFFSLSLSSLVSSKNFRFG